MSKEIAKSKENLPAELTAAGAFGDETVSAKELVLGKILAMQGLSQLVTDGIAKFGEIRESLDGKLLGDLDKPVHLIVFKREMTWVEFDTSSGERVFKTIIPVTPQNEDLPWKDEENEIERDYCYNFYCLLPGDIAGGAAMPLVLSLRRTSTKAGQRLSTLMYVSNKKAGLPPPYFTVMLSGKKVSAENKNYVVMNITKDRVASKEEMLEALEWYKTLATKSHKTDDSDLQTDSAAKKDHYEEGESEQY